MELYYKTLLLKLPLIPSYRKVEESSLRRLGITGNRINGLLVLALSRSRSSRIHLLAASPQVLAAPSTASGLETAAACHARSLATKTALKYDFMNNPTFSFTVYHQLSLQIIALSDNC